MTDPSREIHIHLGVDGVLEDVFQILYKKGALNAQNTDVAYMTPKSYRQDLRSAVDASTSPSFAYPGNALDHDLLISRPRMMFPGTPLNCVSEQHLPLTKLDHLQYIFSEYRVCFHVLLTDHTSYLFRHPKFVAGDPERATSASWRPLVNAIRSKITGPNELFIWNAEDYELFLSAFFNGVLRVPEADWANLIDVSEAAAYGSPSTAECEGFVAQNGLDQEFLDYNYEEDLRQFRDGAD